MKRIFQKEKWSDPEKWGMGIVAPIIVAAFIWVVSHLIPNDSTEDAAITKESSANLESGTNVPPSEQESFVETVHYEGRLPYLREQPILDSTLYITQAYNDFELGGVNLHFLEYNARTEIGDTIEIRDRNGLIELDVWENPYIEFSYRDRFYSIEVVRIDGVFSAIVKEIERPTMDLIHSQKN